MREAPPGGGSGLREGPVLRHRAPPTNSKNFLGALGWRGVVGAGQRDTVCPWGAGLALDVFLVARYSARAWGPAGRGAVIRLLAAAFFFSPLCFVRFGSDG